MTDTTTATRTFARIADVKVGTILVADGGFACLEAGAEREVFTGQDARDLCITCRDGIHWLDGQEGDTKATRGHYVGLYLKEGE